LCEHLDLGAAIPRIACDSRPSIPQIGAFDKAEPLRRQENRVKERTCRRGGYLPLAGRSAVEDRRVGGQDEGFHPTRRASRSALPIKIKGRDSRPILR
jgi:hypothetical protein